MVKPLYRVAAGIKEDMGYYTVARTMQPTDVVLRALADGPPAPPRLKGVPRRMTFGEALALCTKMNKEHEHEHSDQR